jgi:hypothetical protein
MKRLALFLFAAAAVALPAVAWNSVGHRTVAEIAWRQLTPQQRDEFSALLRQHPHYGTLLTAGIPAGANTNEWVFLTAAVWPDRVRPGKKGEPRKPASVTKYNVYPHGIGHPFLRPGDTNVALLANFSFSKPNAEVALSNSIVVLKDTSRSASDRAVSLCWVLHLMGDLHQPLHAATLVSAAKPRGEGLGGGCVVRDLKGEQITLHAYWDDLPGTDGSYRAIASLADELGANPALKPGAMKEYEADRTIPAWVQESFRAAVDFAYAPDRIQYARAEDLAAKRITPADVPMVSKAYADGAKEIAQRRLALAGQRLMDTLKQVRD